MAQYRSFLPWVILGPKFLNLVKKSGNSEYCKNTPVGPEIGHFYPEFGPKSGTPCSPNPLKRFF